MVSDEELGLGVQILNEQEEMIGCCISRVDTLVVDNLLCLHT